MRTVGALAIVLVFVTACGSKQPGAAGPGGAVATVFPSARFVPAKPTYVVSARTMRDAQNSLRDLAELVGMASGVEAKQISGVLTYLLAVDPLNPEAVSGMGVDLDGSMVAFSEDLNPTFVVHINSPEAITAFFDKQRERGLRTTSVEVGKTEVFTAQISSQVDVSWAIEGDWLWVHFTLDKQGGKPEGTAWFEHSRAPAGTKWVDGWTWAKGLSAQAPAVVGIFDLQGLVATVAQRAPGAVDCIQKLSAVERVGFSFDGSGKQLGAKLTFDLGASSQGIASNLLAPPPGWATARANAPMAAEWNLDLRATFAWAQSCSPPDLLAMLDRFGVRAGRAFVHSLDVDEKEGRGAVALDLSNANFMRAQLDQIPRRSMFESSRTFGIYKGKHISVPFIGSGDYVLDDKIAIAAMGDGLLAQIGTGAPTAQPAVLSVDLHPQGMSVGVWQFLLAQLDAPEPERFAQRLMTWSDLHFGAHLDANTLVIEAAGTRR